MFNKNEILKTLISEYYVKTTKDVLKIEYHQNYFGKFY